MSRLRLYRAPFSTNVERVALALAHKGLEVESVVIDYADRSEVERVSGQPLVPVLVDGDEVVVDSTRILEHLEARRPHPALYPAHPARRAEVELFIDWFNRVWKHAPNAIERELARADPDEARIAELGALMQARLGLIDRLLAGRQHLFGEFSAADCAAFPFLKYALGRDAEDAERFHVILERHQQPGPEHAALVDWIRRVNERPRA